MQVVVVIHGCDDVVEVQPNDTVRDLKSRIASELCFTEGVFGIVFEGEILQDETQQISNVGLCDGDRLELHIADDIKARELLRKMGITSIDNDVLAEHASRGEADIAALIIQSGLADGFNQLIRAASTANNALCELLVRAGADVNATSLQATGKSPLLAALKASAWDTAALLIELGADANRVCPIDGDTPLMQAANSREALAFLLRNGANLNFRDRNGCTPLQRCIACGDIECCKLLLQHGADLSASSSCGASPLWYALAQGRAACCVALVEAGADVNCAGPYGETPLMQACLQPSEALAGLLLRHGADVNQSDRSGNTALTRAIDAGRMKTCTLLLTHGAVMTHGAAERLGLVDDGLVARLRRRGGRVKPDKSQAQAQALLPLMGGKCIADSDAALACVPLS